MTLVAVVLVLRAPFGELVIVLLGQIAQRCFQRGPVLFLIGLQLQAGLERGDARVGECFGVFSEILRLTVGLIARSSEGPASIGGCGKGGDCRDGDDQLSHGVP